MIYLSTQITCPNITGMLRKYSKCKFHSELVEYLEYIFSPSGLTMSNNKVKIIQDWPEPKKVKNIQSYLGFANFHCWFIFNYLYIVILLTCLYHIQVYPSGNYIPVVISSPNYTSPSFMVATFLATCLMAMLQPSRYSVFHSGDTPIQLGLPWQSYPCQCLNTETSTWGNRSFITETLSIFYIIYLYIRLVVTL